jgi:hypothetical protein
MSNSPAKLFPVAMAMQAAGGVYNIAKGIIGSKKRKQEQREAQADYRRMKDKILTQDTSNPYAGMENAYEDLTVNQQMNEFKAEQQNQALANTMNQMSAAAGGSGIASLAQAMAQQQTQNIQANAASIGQQEQANQMKMAQGAERVDLLQRKGEMMSREMQANQNKTEFGFAANRLEKANQAREQARQSLVSGITQTATAGLKMGNMFGKSTKIGGFGGGGQDGLGGGFQNHPLLFGEGGVPLRSDNSYGP